MRFSFMLVYHPLLALEASAGSGKTFALSVHYVYLLLCDAHLQPSEILTLTFTNKAAYEMRQKIMHALFLLATKDLDAAQKEQKDIFIHALSEYANVPISTITSKAASLYRRFLASRTNITTLDSFFVTVLKKFCWYAGVPSDFEICEIDDTSVLYEYFLKNLSHDHYNALLDLCLKNQWYSFNDCKKLFESLFQSNIALPDVCIKDVSHDSQWRYYFELFKADVLLYSTSPSAHKALDIKNFYDLLCSTWIIKDYAYEYSYFKKTKNQPNVQEHFENLKKSIRVELHNNQSLVLSHIYMMLGIFQQSVKHWMKQSHKIRIHDIALHVYELLLGRKHNTIDMEFLYFRLDSKITHLLLDEFQDTSVLQFQILEPIINEIVAGFSRKAHRSFFYVGDIKQSIYHFRGSNPELFLHLARSKQITREKLSYNWRSRAEIVDFVNKIFINLYDNYHIQTPKKAGGFVKVQSSFDKDEMLESIVSNLKTFLTKGIRPENIAILAFHNKDLLLVQDYLQLTLPEIPIAKEGSSKLANHVEVKAIYAALRYYMTQNIIEKRRFFALLGCNGDDFLDIKALDFQKHAQEMCPQSTSMHIFDTMRPAFLIKEIMQHYQLSSIQAQKFLELSIVYTNLKDFLQWAKADRELTGGQKHSDVISGVRMLTIHSAKGLEFEHCMVIDCLSKGGSSRDKILLDYDIHSGSQKIFLCEKNKEYFVQDYQKAQQKKAYNEELQALNLLYVALTRAKTSLVIHRLQDKSEFTRLMIDDGEYGHLVGDDIPLRFKEETRTMIVQHDYGRQTDFLREPLLTKPDNLKAFYGGRALHFALELVMKYHLTQHRVDAMLHAHYGALLSHDELATIAQKCNIILKNSEFLEILSKGRIQCETSFLRHNQIFRIDLIVECADEIVVVDYKSSNADRKEHIRQIQAYKDVVFAYYQKPVRGYILTISGLVSI